MESNWETRAKETLTSLPHSELLVSRAVVGEPARYLVIGHEEEAFKGLGAYEMAKFLPDLDAVAEHILSCGTTTHSSIERAFDLAETPALELHIDLRAKIEVSTDLGQPDPDSHIRQVNEITAACNATLDEHATLDPNDNSSVADKLGCTEYRFLELAVDYWEGILGWLHRDQASVEYSLNYLRKNRLKFYALYELGAQEASRVPVEFTASATDGSVTAVATKRF